MGPTRTLDGSVRVDRELAERLDFLNLDEAMRARLVRLKPLIDSELPAALEVFYQEIARTPQVHRLFKDAAHIASAKRAQSNHWDVISRGAFDNSYMANVRKVGHAHARIGLEPRWYIGGYAIVIEHLIRAIVAAMWPKASPLMRLKVQAPEVAESIGIIVKAALLDMDLAISTYVDAAEEARLKVEAAAQEERVRSDDARRAAERQAEEEAIGRERHLVQGSIGAAIGRLAAKDLSARLGEDVPVAYQKLRQEFNQALGLLEGALVQVIHGSGAIETATLEIAQAADDLSRRTEQQAASLEETSAALAEITTFLKQSAGSASEARNKAALARTAAESSRDVVQKAVHAMGIIEASSQQIAQISGVIDEIAFQTNLLALNAGVEAARAGDAGRGFAVVASEVRALAQRSAEAAKEIKSLIAKSADQVTQGVQLVGASGKTLEHIIDHVAGINDMVSEIACATESQASSISEINTAISEMDKSTQQNAAMVEETTAACHALTQQAQDLNALVSEFCVSSEHGVSQPEASSRQSSARYDGSPPTETSRGVAFSKAAARRRTN